MNSSQKNTRQTARVVIVCLITILCIGTDMQARAGIHNTATSHAKPKPASRPCAVTYAAVSPDGRLGASYYGKTQIRIWNKRSGKLLRTVKHIPRDDGNDGMYHYGGVSAITFSRSGKWLLIEDSYGVGTGGAWPTYGTNEITVWNASTGRKRKPLPLGNNEASSRFVFTLNDDTLAFDSIGKYGTSCCLIKINLNSGQFKYLYIYANEGDVNNGGYTYFTPDGKIFKASGYGPDCAIDVATLRPHVGKL